MVRKIARIKDRDCHALMSRCVECTHEEGLMIARDLIDTARDNNDFTHKKPYCRMCTGLSANQIGYDKRVFIIQLPHGSWLPVINPRNCIRYYKNNDKHMSEETCLSTDNVLRIMRYDIVCISFLSWSGRRIIRKFCGVLADRVQHEIGHLNGIY